MSLFLSTLFGNQAADTETRYERIGNQRYLIKEDPEKNCEKQVRRISSTIKPQEGENWESLRNRLQQEFMNAGDNFFYRAIDLSCDRLVERILSSEPEKYKVSRLQDAASRGHLAAVRILLQHDAEPSSSMVNPQYPEIAALLIQKMHAGLEVIFHSAALRGDIRMMQLCLDQGLPVNCRNAGGNTVLGHLLFNTNGQANRSIHLKTLLWLLEKGVDSRQVQWPGSPTTLELVLLNGNYDAANLMLTHGDFTYLEYLYYNGISIFLKLLTDNIPSETRHIVRENAGSHLERASSHLDHARSLAEQNNRDVEEFNRHLRILLPQ